MMLTILMLPVKLLLKLRRVHSKMPMTHLREHGIKPRTRESPMRKQLNWQRETPLGKNSRILLRKKKEPSRLLKQKSKTGRISETRPSVTKNS
jgi:hypothetical protein